MDVSLLAKGVGHVVMFGFPTGWLPPAGIGVGLWEKSL